MLLCMLLVIGAQTTSYCTHTRLTRIAATAATTLVRGSYFNTKSLTSLSGASSNMVESPLEVEKAEIDDRLYSQFFLKNGIPVTVAQDKNSEKSSVSLAVRIGAAADPLPGIAHITEHAVFLGSKKYPVENEYKNFLSKNGGSSNAGTGMEQTTYKFNINSEALPHALDIFSQFFKEPLFNPNAMKREIMAVDAEDSKNRILDNRRLLQVLKHLMNPAASSYSKFSTGNLRTLAFGDVERYGDVLTYTIRRFHETYYRPDRMAVCIVGPQSIEQLTKLAIDSFSDIVQWNASGSFADIIGDSVPADPDAHLLSAKISAMLESDSQRLVQREQGQEQEGNILPFMHALFKKGIIPTPPVDVDVPATTAATPQPTQTSVLRIRPVKDIRDLSIMWQLPSTKKLYMTNPCHLLGFLLRDKGETSLFAALQDKGWASSTSCGVRLSFSSEFTLFQSTVALTPEGLTHWKDVTGMVYAYLDMVAESSDEKLLSIWDEMRTINELDFKFQEKVSAYETAPHIAANMLDYPLHRVMSAGWRIKDLDLSLFRRFLRQLARDQSFLVLRSPDFTWLPKDEPDYVKPLVAKLSSVNEKAQMHSRLGMEREPNTLMGGCEESIIPPEAMDRRIEPYYGVHYGIETISTITEFTMHEPDAPGGALRFSLPTFNKFVCNELLESTVAPVGADEDFVIRSAPPVQLRGPVESRSSIPTNSSLWRSTDDVFRQPRCVMYFQFYSGFAACSDGHPVLALINSMYNQATAREYYQASLASLDYSMGFTKKGLYLVFRGFSSNKLLALAGDVSKQAGDMAFWKSLLEGEADLFDNSKERLLRGLQSWGKERPDQQCDSLLSYLMQQGTWLPQDRLKACEAIDKDMVRDRIARAFTPTDGNSMQVTSYSHGSPLFNLSTIESLYDTVTSQVKAYQPVLLSVSAVGEEAEIGDRARRLKRGTHFIVGLPGFNSEDPNSALLTHIQTDLTSPKNAAVALVLRKLLSEPAFSQLRTKKQLGYIVSLYPSGFGKGLKSLRGITVRILSNRFDPLYMERELGSFLHDQQSAVFGKLTDENVQTLCKSIITEVEDPPTSQSEEAGEFWAAITNDMPFDWSQQVIDELRRLSVVDVQTAADQWLYNPDERKSVSVMLFGNAHLSSLSTLHKSEEYATQTGSEAEEEGEGGLGNIAPFFATGDKRVVLSSLDALTQLRDGLEYVD